MGIDDEYVAHLYNQGYNMVDDRQYWIGEGDMVVVKDPRFPDEFEARVIEVDGEDVYVEYVDYREGLSELMTHISCVEKIG